MRDESEFDVAFEYENAARLPFTDVDLPLVHTMTPIGFDDGHGDTYRPTVWESGERFISGYQMNDNTCVLFMDWPVAELALAKQFAFRVAGLAAGHVKASEK